LKSVGSIDAAAAVAPPVANALPAAPPTQLKAAVRLYSDTRPEMKRHSPAEESIRMR
jgi:hypothetical protein